MREAITRGEICLEDPETAIEYRVAAIEYRLWEDEAFSYVIMPNYSVIDLLDAPLFQGIPGLNLDLRRERYVRENRTPVFVSERAPAENREDVRALLDVVGMEYLDKLEWLMRTDTRYGGDNLYVRRPGEKSPFEVGDFASLAGGVPEVLGLVLGALAAGREVRGDGFVIDDGNRKDFHGLLRALYLKAGGPSGKTKGNSAPDSPGERHGRGRRRKPVDEIRFRYAVERFECGQITADQAAEEAGVSRATFFRRLKEREEEPKEPVLVDLAREHQDSDLARLNDQGIRDLIASRYE